MTYQFDPNNSYAAGQPGEDSTGGAIFRLKALMAAHSAWAVRASGDGLAAYESEPDATGGAGGGTNQWDVITQESTWGGGSAGDMGNENAWFVIREVGSTREFCFKRDVTFQSFGQGENHLEVVHSPGGLFTGGNATTRPTAADEEVINGPSVDWGQANAYSVATVVQIGVADHVLDGGVRPWFIANFEAASGGNMTQVMIYDGVTQYQDADPEPWVMIFGEDLNYDGGLDGGSPRMHKPGASFGGGDAWPYRTAAGYLAVPRGTPVQDDGNSREWPVPIGDAGGRWKGYLASFRWQGGVREYPDTREVTEAQPEPRIYLNDFVGPWATGISPTP